ncbi:hypothetical protein AXF42_Ash009548 [Apostasia shenzhenica]|uniref:Transcription repressor n=1 Tax=Apostasia shenzhenica TaxID=1088818 RepID=A0A2I0B958_9ASPA|nr:hypothetical protein AXF42_Ash009548 [Apostasia shenzhenica]
MRKKTRGERSSSCSEERSEGKSEKTTVEKRKAVNGFAVVKQSEDPYEDFRNSMAEMIVEQRLFRARELGSLLMSYLSLNSPRHHPAIIEAFSELRSDINSNEKSIRPSRIAQFMQNSV